MKLLHSIQSEWLKTRRSTASWLCLIGGFFVPVIHFIIFLVNRSSINHIPHGNAWEAHFYQLWQNMSMFLLPMGVVMASSLIAQVEYRNNAWKQVHTTPQSYTTIFAAKFIVIVLMTVKFFVFFNIGIFLSGVIPSLIFDGVWPDHTIPVGLFLKENFYYFITCLPIIALQFLISLRFKNFLVPIGTGFLFLVGSLIGLTWKYIVISPFSFTPLYTIKAGFTTQTILLLAGLHFLVIMSASFWLYTSRSEKG